MGNIARLYEGEEMKALEALDLTNYGIEEMVEELHFRQGSLWRIALALHHRYQSPTPACVNLVCEKCQTAQEVFLYIEKDLGNDIR
jgi:hypothetical protein